MSTQLNGIAGKLGQSIIGSRRRFLLAMGSAALATAGALAGNLASRVSSRPSKSKFVDSGPGACYYPSGGTIICQQTSATTCATIPGGSYMPGGNCILHPSPTA
jgi:hypothetical protein